MQTVLQEESKELVPMAGSDQWSHPLECSRGFLGDPTKQSKKNGSISDTSLINPDQISRPIFNTPREVSLQYTTANVND